MTYNIVVLFVDRQFYVWDLFWEQDSSQDAGKTTSNDHNPQWPWLINEPFHELDP